MKKVLVVLLLLAVAGGLFAQSLTWTGNVRTGIRFEFGDTPEDPTAKADDDDAGVPVRANLNAAYDAGVWGVKFGSRADFTPTDGNAGVVFYNAHGWMKFLNDMITVRAGKIDEGVWGTGGDVDQNVSNDLGIRVEVTPIDGLNIGALFNYPNGTGVGPAKIADWFGETAFGASYTADVWKVSAALKLYSEASDVGFTADSKLWDLVGKRTALTETDMKFIFGAGFTGITNLEILVNGAVEGLGDYSTVGGLTVAEEARYTMGALKFGIVVREWMAGDSDWGFFRLVAKPLVEYKVNDSITVGADVPIIMMKQIAIGGTDDALAFAELDGNIWAQYNIATSWIKAGYGFTMKTEDFGDALDHHLKIVFNYAF